MNPRNKRRSTFSRWTAKATKGRDKALQHAVDALVPPLENAGFQWMGKSLDCGTLPSHTINLEREPVPGEIDFVMIIFDKYHVARFQMLFGTKEKETPHRWIRSGALVWKKRSESLKFKWWGARWWSLDKNAALAAAAETATSLLPQVLRFLSEGSDEKNIFASTIPERESIGISSAE